MRITFSILLSCICIYLCANRCSKYDEKKSYCGTVKYKIDATEHTKSGERRDPILVMNFDEKGVREIHPNWDTYMSAQVGQRLCFKLFTHDDRTPGIFWSLGMLLSIIIGTIVTIAIASHRFEILKNKK